MIKTVIWGAGHLGKKIYDEMEDKSGIIAFADKSDKVQGTEYDGVPIRKPEDIIPGGDFDRVIVATIMGLREVETELKEKYELPYWKIDSSYARTPLIARINFLKCYARMIQKENIGGVVAEAGVFRGEFAKEINKYFPERKCYLFDTFEGFDQADLKEEYKRSDTGKTDLVNTSDYLADTSVEKVLARMPHPEKIEVRKGYFPETAEGINDEFCFVNLDMDLYQPTKEGLRFFYPKLVKGGVMLIHDYFSGFYVLEQAVSEYEEEIGMRLSRFPVGDDYSLGIIKV